jgi:acyl-CoA reductase-like NAD-dependent aldehyde dehydrogenase
MSTKRVIVHESLVDEFKSKLLELMKKVRCGNHLISPDVSMSGLYTPASAMRIMRLVERAIAARPDLLTGDLKVGGLNATILAPHVLDKATLTMEIFHKETFGLIISLTQVSSDNEAVKIANSTKFSLSST